MFFSISNAMMDADWVDSTVWSRFCTYWYKSRQFKARFQHFSMKLFVWYLFLRILSESESHSGRFVRYAFWQIGSSSSAIHLGSVWFSSVRLDS